MSFQVDISWLDGTGIADPAEAATWAEIGIQVGTVPFTELLDERLGVRRTTFFGSALPLAEWIANCWPRLIHERRGPQVRESLLSRLLSTPIDREWLGYHSFRAARQGGAMPFLVARRQSPETFELHGYADHGPLAPGISVRFLRHAEEVVPANAVMAELHKVVEATLQKVAAIETERVKDLRKRWVTVQSKVAGLAGRLGLDDEEASDAERETIAALLKDEKAEDVIALAEGGQGSSVSENIAFSRKVLASLPSTKPAGKKWRQIQEEVEATRHDRPWLTGWKAAAAFRKAVSAKEAEAPGRELPKWLEEKCGWDRKEQSFALEAKGEGVDTVYYVAEDRQPAVLTSVEGPRYRFRLAGGLYHFLFCAPGRLSPRSPLLPEFSETNAFAAELLAPVSRLREFAPPHGSYWSSTRVGEAAIALEVSPKVVRHQIENRGLGHIAGAPAAP